MMEIILNSPYFERVVSFLFGALVGYAVFGIAYFIIGFVQAWWRSR